ncbi:hypothetical protein SCL_1901 [Sulfuricaulis limicola]|uniref:Uncharacterized protein n=1 Tax=Sulfuricaulis limicola TaxID=1620215 RepID=A0A1B4XHC0_9GAMM|nr:hypothetical protein SCL_1901 [Sulfuricaulis limicola]
MILPHNPLSLEGEGGGEGERLCHSAVLRPSPYLFSPGVRQNRAHPLGGEKVHRTFSRFRLAPGGERD